MAAGFWTKVPEPGLLVPVTVAQLWNDLITYSDQKALSGWQARDSYFRLLSFAIRKFAERNQTVTKDTLFFYYTGDATMDLAVIASAVELEADDLVQPRYARMTYVLDPTTGFITDFGVHVFSRWTFASVGVTNPAPTVSPEAP